MLLAVMHVGLHVKCRLLVCGVYQIGFKDKFQLKSSVSNFIKAGSARLQLFHAYTRTNGRCEFCRSCAGCRGT